MKLDDKINVACINDEGNIPSFYIRFLEPTSYLTSNYNWSIASHFMAEEIVKQADIVIFQRTYSDRARFLFEAAASKNKRIIYETDDYFLDLPKTSGVKITERQKNNIRLMISQCNVVMCSTETLKNVLLPLNNSIKVIKNYAPSTLAENKEKDTNLCVAIVNTDYFKLENPAPLLKAIEHSARALNIKFVFFGSTNDAIRRIASNNQNIQIVSEFIPNRQEFIAKLRSLKINAAIVPLDETYHHSFKSDIKFYDFAAICAPGIFNNASVYSSVIHQANGVLCQNSYADWLHSLQYLSHSETREKLGSRAFSDACKNTITSYAQELKQLIEGF